MVSRLIPIALVVVLLAAPLAAHPGHDHRIMGTVVKVAGFRMSMEAADGQTVAFTVNTETKFVRGRGEGKVSDVKAGMRIIINVGDGIEPLVAKEVRYAETEVKEQASKQ